MSKVRRIAVTITIVLFLTLVVMAIYRTFFQFKNNTVRAYIKQEAAKFTNSVQAEYLLSDAVQHILSNRSLTKEVTDYAKAMGLEKEQVLVTAALKQATAYGYLG
jgi:hypothetical protein